MTNAQGAGLAVWGLFGRFRWLVGALSIDRANLGLALTAAQECQSVQRDRSYRRLRVSYLCESQRARTRANALEVSRSESTTRVSRLEGCVRARFHELTDEVLLFGMLDRFRGNRRG